MTRPACAVAVALASPLVGVAAGVATHTGTMIAVGFAACLIAAPIISKPEVAR